MNKFMLRKLHYDSDIGFLYDLMTNPQEQIMFQCNLPINSIHEFKKWFDANLRIDYHDFFIVEDVENKTVAGFVFSYAFKPYDLHCKITSVLFPSYRKMGIGAAITLCFIDYMFVQYPINKIFFDVYSYNQESLTSNLKAGFVLEATIKEYRFYSGIFHDLSILSISRNDFYIKYANKITDYFKCI